MLAGNSRAAGRPTSLTCVPSRSPATKALQSPKSPKRPNKVRLSRGRQLQQAPARPIFEQIDCSIRPLADEADSVTHVPLLELRRRIAADSHVDQRLA